MKTADEARNILKTIEEDDREFTERFRYFAFEQVPNTEGVILEDRPRHLAILCALIASSSLDLYSEFLPLSLDGALTPVEVKEILYQAGAYIGIGKTYPFINMTNLVFKRLGIPLPLDNQSNTTLDDRREKGTQAQVDIFGPQMADFYKNGTINYFLASNCFGDYYTRSGLNLKDRELVTFCLLSAFGGVEPQLTSHARANIKMGNDPEFLLSIINQMVPYIGYPRSLNAINCLNAAKQ